MQPIRSSTLARTQTAAHIIFVHPFASASSSSSSNDIHQLCIRYNGAATPNSVVCFSSLVSWWHSCGVVDVHGYMHLTGWFLLASSSFLYSICSEAAKQTHVVLYSSCHPHLGNLEFICWRYKKGYGIQTEGKISTKITDLSELYRMVLWNDVEERRELRI